MSALPIIQTDPAAMLALLRDNPFAQVVTAGARGKKALLPPAEAVG